MCGFTSTMLNDWTVNTNTQVLIYPVYDSINTSNELDLGLAGNECPSGTTFTTTDANGAYDVSGLPPGHYTIPMASPTVAINTGLMTPSVPRI
jgi:hypothetical protein